jgi:hypothetical protein
LWVKEIEYIYALFKECLDLYAIFIVFEAFTFGETIFKSSFVDHSLLIGEANLALTLFDAIHILSFVLKTIVVDIDSLSMLFPLQEKASIAASWLFQHSFISKLAIFIKFAIIAVFILFTRNRPPFKLSAFLNSIFICP